jgi:hypothetical protein
MKSGAKWGLTPVVEPKFCSLSLLEKGNKIFGSTFSKSGFLKERG